jgi:hypothetical protein
MPVALWTGLQWLLQTKLLFVWQHLVGYVDSVSSGWQHCKAVTPAAFVLVKGHRRGGGQPAALWLFVHWDGPLRRFIMLGVALCVTQHTAGLYSFLSRCGRQACVVTTFRECNP